MFKGAVTIATISGVPVRVHWTFFILVAWVFGSELYYGGSLADAVAAVAFVAAIFGCVVAHEFGHILAARSFGVRTRDVTLLPIGGVATLERMPERPWQELVVAIAGPLVNVAIALVLVPIVLVRGGLESLATLGQPGHFVQTFLASLAAINISLVLFNMIPAFPMDGGRVLRAVLAMHTDRATATRIAAKVGQILAICMGLAGLLLGRPLLLVLAVFVYIGAKAEAAATEARRYVAGLTAADVMIREFRVLGEHDRLQAAVDAMLAGPQADFPVTRDGTPRSPLVGLLLRGDVVRALAERGPSAPVGTAMRPPYAAVRPDAPALQLLQVLQRSACPLVAVVEGETLVGVLTPEHVRAMVLGRSARGRPADA